MAGGRGRLQVVHGAGGVGKTHLALEYAYRHLSHYPLIWWLPADEPNTLASYFLALAEQLGVIAAGDNDVRAARRAGFHALREGDDCVLVFAAAPDAACDGPCPPA